MPGQHLQNNSGPESGRNCRSHPVQGPLYTATNTAYGQAAVYAIFFGVSVSYAEREISKCLQLDLDVSVCTIIFFIFLFNIVLFYITFSHEISIMLEL